MLEGFYTKVPYTIVIQLNYDKVTSEDIEHTLLAEYVLNANPMDLIHT